MNFTNLMNIFMTNSDFFYFAGKLLLDLAVIYILIRVIYFKTTRNRSYLFMFGVFNLIIFLVCTMLSHLVLSLGFSFGIFAIFSILRYRTTSVPIKEMTYLFISISLGMINALANETVSVLMLVFTNITILGVTYFLEKVWLRNEIVKYIIYEKIELVKPQNHAKLLEDLQERTGLKINRVEVGKINFLRDVAELRVFFENTTGYNFVNNNDGDDDE